MSHLSISINTPFPCSGRKTVTNSILVPIHLVLLSFRACFLLQTNVVCSFPGRRGCCHTMICGDKRFIGLSRLCNWCDLLNVGGRDEALLPIKTASIPISVNFLNYLDNVASRKLKIIRILREGQTLPMKVS